MCIYIYIYIHMYMMYSAPAGSMGGTNPMMGKGVPGLSRPEPAGVDYLYHNSFYHIISLTTFSIISYYIILYSNIKYSMLSQY